MKHFKFIFVLFLLRLGLLQSIVNISDRGMVSKVGGCSECCLHGSSVWTGRLVSDL